MVEARKDVTVVLHPLTDDRRILPLERTGELLEAPPEFMLVVSYNPGYQNVLKSLKPSTRQRFVAVEFGFPPPDAEAAIVAHGERPAAGPLRAAGAAGERAARAEGPGPRGGRLDPPAGLLRHADRGRHEAADAILAAMIEPLTDEPDVKQALLRVAEITLG